MTHTCTCRSKKKQPKISIKTCKYGKYTNKYIHKVQKPFELIFIGKKIIISQINTKPLRINA